MKKLAAISVCIGYIATWKLMRKRDKTARLKAGS